MQLATKRPSFRSRAGITLIEIMIVIAILTVSLAMFAQTLSASARLDPVANETMLAAEGSRVMIERMRAQPFDQVYALYDANPANDPGGAGTAPGSTFAIEGLSPATVGGVVGRIEFPVVTSQLRENSTDEMLGMPRDLNGDLLVDTANHAGDYLLLPVRVRVEWASKSGHLGRRSMEFYAMFSPL
jgi:Tfp pilus assembly protein PilV